MPPVTRTPAHGPPAWLSTPIRTARATPTRGAAPPRGSPVTADDCCICCSSLPTKRWSTLRPCAHRYHETCVRTWMETREDRSGQTCPMCRTRTTAVVNEDGRSAPPAFPYGDSGEPRKNHLIYHNQPENLEWLLRETEEQLGRCSEATKNESRGREYMEDVKAEISKLQMRRSILALMLQEVERGEWRLSAPRPRRASIRPWMAAARLPQHDQIYVYRPPPAEPRAAARPVQPDPNDWSQARPNTVAEPFRAGRATALSASRAAEGAAARAAARAASAAAAAARAAARPQPAARRPSTAGGAAPRFMQPTASAAARQAATRASVTAAPAAAGRLVAAPSRRSSTAAVAAAPQPRAYRPSLPNGATPFPAARHANNTAIVAAAAVAVQPIRPDEAATSRFQLQPTAATLARQEAEARQQQAEAAAPAYRVLRPFQVTSVSPRTAAAAFASSSSASTRPPRPHQQQAVRVSAAGAGPAARRRLSGLSSTPNGAPARRPRHQQPVAEPRVIRVYINTTPSVSSEDDEEEEEVMGPPSTVPVNYHETPRRSERIAAVARRRLESAGH